MKNKVIKFIFKFVVFLAMLSCFSLSSWQYFRYKSKSERESLINNVKNNLASEKYKILNKRLYSEYLELSKNESFFLKKVIFCGIYDFDNILLVSSNSSKYDIYINVKNFLLGLNFLTKYISLDFKSKADALKYIDEIKLKKNEYVCLSGLFYKLPFKENFLYKIIRFNMSNYIDNNKIIVNSLSEIRAIFKDNIFIILDEKDENIYQKINKNHHIGYMFMWFCLAIYLVYLFKKA